MICPNIRLRNFGRDAGTTRDSKAPTMRSAWRKGILPHGFIIKDATSIIMNIGSPLAYYEQGKGAYLIHDETRELLEYILHMLDEKGEKKTFAYMRKYMVGKKEYPRIKK